MPGKWESVSLPRETIAELRQAHEAGRFRDLGVRSVPHALEVAARRLLKETRQGA
jgi:hypothetical protein